MAEEGIRIRAAVPADLEHYLDVVDAVASEGRWIGHEQPIDRQALTKRWLEALEDDAALRLVVDVGDDLAGLLSADEYHGIVSFGMMLRPGWRGQGIGRRLLDETVAWARSRGAHKLTLQVWPHNTAAIRLYERYGFEVEGRLRAHWRRRNSELWDALVMGLLLDGAGAGGPAYSGA